jgi:hypothetical protein
MISKRNDRIFKYIGDYIADDGYYTYKVYLNNRPYGRKQKVITLSDGMVEFNYELNEFRTDSIHNWYREMYVKFKDEIDRFKLMR